MTHRSRLMRAVRECTDLAQLRAAVIEVACDLEESKRDTIPAPPPDYWRESSDAAPPTPLTVPPAPRVANTVGYSFAKRSRSH